MLDRFHFHRAILDHLQEPVIACDSAGLIQYMNPAAERLMGWPLWEAVNQNAGSILDPEGGNWGGPGLRELMCSGECLLQQPCNIMSRWGKSLERKVNVSPLYQGAYRCGTVLVFDKGLQPGDDEL